MESRAKFLGQPLHPKLMALPMGLLIVSLVFDILYAITGSGGWSQMSFWLIVTGVVTGIFAAVPGVVDWMAIPRRTRARRIGTAHALVMAAVLLLFAVSWGMRVAQPLEPTIASVLVSVLGVALIFVGSWLGSELVDRLGVGVDEGANLNAPNSLMRRKMRDEGAVRRGPQPSET